MTDISADKLPEGPIIKGKLSRDDVIMRLGMVVIALYLAFIVYLIINGKFSDNVLAIVPMICLFPALLPSVLNRSAIKAELAKRNGNSGSDE